MIDDQTLELYAQMAAQQLIAQYVPYARNLNLTKEQTIKLIRRTAEIAAETINRNAT